MRLARSWAAESSVVAAFDQLLVPALQLMAADQATRAITSEASSRGVADLAAIGARLAPKKATRVADVDIVGVAAESDADALLLQLLDGLLAERGSGLRPIAPGPRDDVLSRALESRPVVVCIAMLPPAGNSNARYFCRQIRKHSPETLIIALAPHAQPLANEVAARLREAARGSSASGVLVLGATQAPRGSVRNRTDAHCLTVAAGRHWVCIARAHDEQRETARRPGALW